MNIWKGVFIHTWVIEENFKEKVNVQIISKRIIQDFLVQLWMNVNWDNGSWGKWGGGWLAEKVCEEENKVQCLRGRTSPKGFLPCSQTPTWGFQSDVLFHILFLKKTYWDIIITLYYLFKVNDFYLHSSATITIITSRTLLSLSKKMSGHLSLTP